MKSNRWEVAKGASNLGEDDIRVAVFKCDENEGSKSLLKIAYCAYSGLKIIELYGVNDVVIDETGVGPDSTYDTECMLGTTDWEVAFLAKMTGVDNNVLVSINDCENVTIHVLGNGTCEEEYSHNIFVSSVEEYMADEYDNLDIELLKIFSYI